jgi:pseudouridine-5'-phosphate glycosidase/pseudouridine kinase
LISGLARGGRVDKLVDVAQRGAVLTLKSAESVSPLLGTLTEEVQNASTR